jgi:adenosylmethionine-8-amino-7-oxononanoate aminotransferase
MEPRPSSNAELARRDLAVLWHPCTQMHDHQSLPMVPIARGEGAWLIDHDGRRYLDAISSWWVNLFGHCHPRINAAVKSQIERLEHTLLAGFTHEPAIALAEKLVRAAPAGLTRVFYADNGASAVEIALKMSFHWWRNQGAVGKRRFVALAGSYHGETLGALAVTDQALYRETYAPLLLESLIAPAPDNGALAPGESPAEHARRRAAELDALLAQRHAEICAVILEPLVQGAAGMRIYDPEYLRCVRASCDRHRVHLIADEIAVGFGRTGTLFACEQAGIAPDLMCLSKGLSGGYLPLAAVLANESIYQGFYADYATRRAFLHSHSYTGNPLACSAALATLALFEEQPVLARISELGLALDAALAPLASHPNVANVRRIGLIGALDLVVDRATGRPFPWQERRGLEVYRHALTRGVLLRPLGNVIYFMPPYVVTPEEIALMVEVAAEGVELAARGAGCQRGLVHGFDPAALEI